VQKDPLWVRTLIGENSRVGAIVVDSANTSPAGQVELVSAIEQALKPHREAGFRFALSGNPLFHVASQREAMAEAAVIGVATGAVIALCFFFLIGSWQSVVGVMTSVGLGTGFGLGVIAILGWSWDPLTSAAPTLILVMGCADSMHYLTSYWRNRAHQRSRHDSLIDAARETATPCAMTTATSAAGLVSFTGTQSVGFSHFGVVTAVGVLACLVLTFTLLPALLSCLPDGRVFALRETERWERIVTRLIEFPIANKRSVLVISAAAALFGAIGLTRLTTDAHPLSYWREGHPTRVAFEYVSEHLSSIEGVEIRLTLPEAFEEGGAVERLEQLETDIARIPGVRGTRSLLTVLNHSARALGADELNAANAGEVFALVALSDESVFDPWVSIDHRTLRFSVSADPLGVEARNRMLENVEVVTHGLPDGWRAQTTGASVLQRSIDDVVRDSALQAFSGTSLIVAALVMAFLRSIRWGALAMLPNLLPMVVLFGLMGFFGIALDAGTALVAPIAIGIAVDDTIHFLHAFTSERRRGVPSVEATRRAGRLVGRAVVTTSGTLAAGFLAMLVSRFQSMANIGLLSAAAIVSAFAAELLVLPALIAFVSEGARTRLREPRTSE
jgi:predicted RND superfamily exporter protein